MARSVLVGVLLFVAYYLLPLNKPESFDVLLLVGGLILIAVVVAWPVRAIRESPFPRPTVWGFHPRAAASPAGWWTPP